MKNKKPHNFKDLTGKRFGILLVLGLSKIKLSKTKSNYWRCKCDCGNEKIVVTCSLTSGRTKSCGCLRRSKAYNNKYVGEISGLFWAHVKSSAKSRNIEVLITQEEAWHLFLKQNRKCALTGRELIHKKYIGKDLKNNDVYTKGTASLDRIDSNKPYTIDNVQWVHKDINWLKNRFSQKEFIKLCEEVTKHATKTMY